MTFLCVDIGGTNTLVGLGDEEFESVEKFKTEYFLKEVDSNIERVLEETDSESEDLETVSLAVAGPIDREEMTFKPPNFSGSGLEEVDLEQIFDDFEDIIIVNDGTAAVAGEYFYGDHGVEDLVYLTISSGIGAGVVLEGNIIEGWNGNFAEVGHMKINDEGPECGCGNRAHWEAYSSGENLPDMASELFGAEFSDALEIFEAYHDADPEAEKVISRMHEANVTGVKNIVDILNPEKIVLGGAIPLNHQEMVLEPLRNKVGSEAINNVPDITLCSLGEESVLHGLRAVCNGEFKPSQG